MKQYATKITIASSLQDVPAINSVYARLEKDDNSERVNALVETIRDSGGWVDIRDFYRSRSISKSVAIAMLETLVVRGLGTFRFGPPPPGGGNQSIRFHLTLDDAK